MYIYKYTHTDYTHFMHIYSNINSDQIYKCFDDHYYDSNWVGIDIKNTYFNKIMFKKNNI